MRSIIFTSAIVMAGLAEAQDGPTPGCYAREYGQAHLDAHPAQVVRNLYLMLHDQDHGAGPERYAYMVVDFADQGHVRADGHGAQRLDQSLKCFTMGDGRKGCAVDCDGGSFLVARETADSLTIATDYLWMGDNEGCGGKIDLAEFPGRAVKYRLNRADPDVCLAQVRD